LAAFRLTLAYDGAEFAGSQVQPGERTVQGELERALSTLATRPVRAALAGRTDRGVHAAGQVAVVSLPHDQTPAELHRALAAMLPHDMAVTGVVRCTESFHPRFDALWREYRYWVAPGAESPLLRRFAWTPRSALDQSAMANGARLIVGKHDFASFASGGEGVPWSDRAARPKGTTRSVIRSDCRLIQFDRDPTCSYATAVIEVRVVADGFLPRMVRNIVAALVEIGRGNQAPIWIESLLAAKDRRQGPPTAPANGLTLWRIGFRNDAPDDA
jgi:tRNA pseudouridine38-40 synthase